jgi:hypothetical protein
MATSSTTNRNSDRIIRSCSLELTGKELDPKAVSARLGIQADRSFSRGDLSPHGRLRLQGLWSYESDNHISSSELSEHIKFIVEFLELGRDKILQTKTSMNIDIRVRVFWDFDGTISAAIDHALLKTLSDIVDGFDLSIT